MRNSPLRTSIIDLVIEAAIPVFIIGLIWSVVTFAIAIKGVFYPGQEHTLTIVFFLYVMGTVMANRLAGLYGESDRATIYSVLLVVVMALFALVFSGRYGSMFGGADAGEGLFANLVIVAVVGFAAYKLCRESCFDIKDVEPQKSSWQLRAEVRAKQDWYRQELEQEEVKQQPEPEKEKKPEARERMPGIWTIYFSLFAMAFFAVGQRLLPQDDGVLYNRTFFCLMLNLVCALALLLLTTFSSLRFRCWQKKARIPVNVGWFWILAGGASILLVISLASLPPRPTPQYLLSSLPPEESVNQGASAPESEAQSGRTDNWGGMSKKIEASLEKEQRDLEKMKKPSDEGSEGGGSKEPEAQENGSGGAAPREQSAGGTSTAKGKSAGRSGEMKSQRAPAVRPPPPMPAFEGIEMIGKILLIILLVIGALAALIKLLLVLGQANLIGGIRNRLNRFGNALRRLLALRPRRRLPRKKQRAVLQKAGLYLENPFANPQLLKSMSRAELIHYTYGAFENFAYIHGHAPAVGQTPLEFLRSLPSDFQLPEAAELLNLFMLAQYSTHRIPASSSSTLQNIWQKIKA